MCVDIWFLPQSARVDSKDAGISWSIHGEETPVTGANVCFMDKKCQGDGFWHRHDPDSAWVGGRYRAAQRAPYNNHTFSPGAFT